MRLRFCLEQNHLNVYLQLGLPDKDVSFRFNFFRSQFPVFLGLEGLNRGEEFGDEVVLRETYKVSPGRTLGHAHQITRHAFPSRLILTPPHPRTAAFPRPSGATNFLSTPRSPSPVPHPRL